MSDESVEETPSSLSETKPKSNSGGSYLHANHALKSSDSFRSGRMSNSGRLSNSREVLYSYLRSLTKTELTKILTPVKDGLITEDSVLHLNTQNFSVDHVIIPMNVRELLKEMGPAWKKWMYSGQNSIPIDPLARGNDQALDLAHEDALSPQEVREFVTGLSTLQKRSIVNLIREGVLTDESHINASTYKGPERVQIPVKTVVDILQDNEKEELKTRRKMNVFLRILNAKHYSSACYKQTNRADLDVRQLSVGRRTMSIWYTVLFVLTVFGTFVSHIWSEITNFAGISDKIQVTTPIIILIVSSLLIGVLMYLTVYMTGFLICCESSLNLSGLESKNHDGSKLYIHFSKLHFYERRILITKAIQFLLLWYTTFLSIYAHENRLNLYPALACVLTNGFGLVLYARIANFFRCCRVSSHGVSIAAR